MLLDGQRRRFSTLLLVCFLAGDECPWPPEGLWEGRSDEERMIVRLLTKGEVFYG